MTYTVEAAAPYPLPAGVRIEVRRPQFDYATDEPDHYWVDGDAFATRFVEALSMFFPDGERFFVESVKHYESRIDDPELRDQVKGFTRQEGQHSSEHRRYNEHVAGRRAARYQGIARHLLYRVAKPLSSPRTHLAITVALEHYTAILAHELLKNREYASRMDPRHRALWLWHAVEETEHKGVAYDVYRAIGGGYARRAITMLVVSVGFLGATAYLTGHLLRRDGRLFERATVRSFVRWALRDPGLFVAVAPEWAKFFQPDFHPWQIDATELIDAWKTEYASA